MSSGLHAVLSRLAPTSLLALGLLSLPLAPAWPGAVTAEPAAATGASSFLPPDFRDQLGALRGDLTEHPAGVARTALHRAVTALTGPQAVTAPDDPDSAGPRLLSAAGDLNADGVPDAVEMHGWLTSTHPRWLLGGHLSAAAVDGRHGGTLWSQPFESGSGWDENDYGFGTAVPIGDLDGAAGDDLLLIDVAEYRYGKVWSWGIGYAGVAGRDGTELWRRTYHNPSVFETNASYTAFVDINLAIPLSAGDADGDGVRDLLIGRHHYVFGYSDGTYISQQAQVMGFDVLSGATGQVLSRIVEPDLPASAEAAFVPDVTGDGRDDVVTLTGAADPVAGTWAGVASAYRGVLGTPVWRASLTAPGVPQVFGHDLTGDGSGEVVVLARGWDLAAADLVTTVRVLSGSDGRPLWSHREDGIALLLRPGDATGDGGADLLSARVFQYDDAMLRLTLLDGATGRVGWSSDHPGGLVQLAGDLTGDGAADLLARAVPYIGDDSEQPAVVVSSRTGDEVWSIPVGVDDRLRPLFADLDRDGSDDIVHGTAAGDGGTYQALSGRDGTPLWQRPVRYRGRLLRLAAVTGTMDVAPGVPRILESVCGCDGTPGKHVATARDAAGVRVWRRVDGAPLPPPR